MTRTQRPLTLSLGPITYYWPRTEVMNFYHQVAESEVPLVYLGETVCSKRRELQADDWIDVARMLREAGKTVVLSTLTLLEAGGELKELRRWCDNGEFMVEANDIGAVQLLAERRVPFTVGPAINVYNASTLAWLVAEGMQRWVMPVELSRDWLLRLLSEPEATRLRDRFEVEVFAFGHLPLAWSARCFTARSENRSKDDCQLCCLKYPEGRRVESQDGRDVFTLNGIQTQSGTRYNLIDDVDSLHGLVDRVRISPQYRSTFDWLEAFAQALAGDPDRLARPVGDVNGYWHQLAGITQL